MAKDQGRAEGYAGGRPHPTLRHATRYLSHSTLACSAAVLAFI